MLEENGFLACWFTSKTEGYDWIVQYQPDLIISDINCRDLNGFQLLEWLKANPYTRHLPFMFLTSVDDLPTALRSVKRGAADYVTKPYDRRSLLETIHRILRQSPEQSTHLLRPPLRRIVEEGKLEFEPWPLLNGLFRRTVARGRDRVAYLQDDSWWSTTFVLDSENELYGGKFFRPLDFNMVTIEDVRHYRESLDDLGVDHGLMIGFYLTGPSLEKFAYNLRIRLVDKFQTAALLNDVIENRKPLQKKSLIASLGDTQ
jgi:CheY-like chemotaxis protein